jgi:tripartite-type tricarboxylate transporter receptor subunit TctC
MLKKLCLLSFSVFFVVFIATQIAFGADYPTKPIEILSPYAPGAAADSATRLAAEIASKYLGQRIVVVNRVGAGGSIAASEVITSKPDGYKLANLSNIFFATTSKTQNIPFDPKDLVPIANIVELRIGIFVRADSPYKTLGDLLNYAKKNPGKVTWAHGGRGLSTHINATLLFRKAGVETVDVPQKSGAELVTALLGGHVDAVLPGYGTVRDHIAAGKVRPLVFFSDHRYPDMPDVPSATELGFPESAKFRTLFGIYAHKDTPVKIRETLTEAFKKASENLDLKKGIEKLGDDPRYGGPEFMNEAIRNAETLGVPIIKELGLYVGK